MNNIGQSAGKISYWLGGIIDGEGCIHIEKTTRKCGTIKLVPYIKITNMDTVIIKESEEEINKVTGCYISTRKIKNGLCYEIIVKGHKRCLQLVPELIPILRGRKKQKAIKMLEWLEYRENRPHNESMTQIDLDFYSQVNKI